MTNLLMLIPVALALGGIGLLAFLWALRSGQFDDLDGAANRILFDYDENDANSAGDDKLKPVAKDPSGQA
ncbi:MAG TPA: cbb3-type cytochrome oxidase assembly protein CcoS [Rhodospirillaceae bacterium]|nr:cbb3-type cytochrome oxidase assembly protein CcoS [Rhodospirillaceae bacterium]